MEEPGRNAKDAGAAKKGAEGDGAGGKGEDGRGDGRRENGDGAQGQVRGIEEWDSHDVRAIRYCHSASNAFFACDGSVSGET